MAGARNAARMLSPDPKGYIHLAKIVVTIMKHLSLIALLFILSAGSGEGTMYLYGGSDAYGQGLSYPDYSSPLSLASFVTGNNTTAISPVFLIATVFRPEFRFINQNGSGYYHPIQPLWDQFTFYLPFLSTQDWFSGNYDSYVPAVKNFLKEDWKPAASDHVTPTMRQFMQEDGYREGVEQHNDPDRMGLNHFLDDDEPPGRPLL
jgi:hypothetical protein